MHASIPVPEASSAQGHAPAPLLRCAVLCSAVVITVPSSLDGKACGLVNMHAKGWEGLRSPGDYANLLRLNSDRIPEDWLGPVSAHGGRKQARLLSQAWSRVGSATERE
jgi:hypothetical protein